MTSRCFHERVAFFVHFAIHQRGWSFFMTVAALVGCRPQAPTPAPLRPDSVVRTRVASTDSIRDPALAAALQEARERSNLAGTWVDTIVVRPDTLRVQVGQAIEPFMLLTIEGRSSRGDPVPHFAPLMVVADHSIAQFTASGLVGRRAGITWLVLSPLTADATTPAKRVRSMVWVVVEP